MTDRPNTGGNWQINYSWTQPYLPTSYNPFEERKATVAEEMIRIEAVDNIVQNQLTYPDAERIINTIMKQGGRDA